MIAVPHRELHHSQGHDHGERLSAAPYVRYSEMASAAAAASGSFAFASSLPVHRWNGRNHPLGLVEGTTKSCRAGAAGAR